MPLRACRYTYSGLAGIDASLLRKIRKGTRSSGPPLYWEYRDLVLPDKPDLFIRLTIVPRFYMGDPPRYLVRLQLLSGPDEGLQPWRAEGLLRRLKDIEPVWSVSVRRTAFRRCDIDSQQDMGAGFRPPEQRPGRYHFSPSR